MEKFNMTKLRLKKGGVFLTEPPETRFWRAVDIKSDNECWEWRGGRHYKGYGEFQIAAGNKTKAHRYAYMSKKGAIPEGMVICHSCDNPPCCNPSHLSLGTHKTNKEESIARGRHAIGIKSGRAKLSVSDVLEIRRLDKIGDRTRLSIAAQFKISGRNLTSICRYETWTHVA